MLNQQMLSNGNSVPSIDVSQPPGGAPDVKVEAVLGVGGSSAAPMAPEIWPESHGFITVVRNFSALPGFAFAEVKSNWTAQELTSHVVAWAEEGRRFLREVLAGTAPSPSSGTVRWELADGTYDAFNTRQKFELRDIAIEDLLGRAADAAAELPLLAREILSRPDLRGLQVLTAWNADPISFEQLIADMRAHEDLHRLEFVKGLSALVSA